jgi:glycosyltransferase involved in cell wall biosynthesis
MRNIQHGDAMNKKISIVIPAYNEGVTLPKLVTEVSQAFIALGMDFEIIVIDDGSKDETWAVLQSCFNDCEQLKCIRFTRNFGKEAAIYAGLKISSGEAVIVMDADLQHPPEILPEMIRAWNSAKVQLVEAVKEKRQKESPMRAFGSYVFYNFFMRATGLDLRNSSDYKLLDRQLVERYLNLPENMRFFRGLTKWFGYSSYVIKYSPPERFGKENKSRWTIRGLFDLARSSLISFTSLPIRIITWFGVTTFVISVLLGIHTLWMKLSGLAVEGFATVILVTLGVGSVIMISMGLIGEYIAHIYEEIKRRPLYVIEDHLDRGFKGSREQGVE